jgi:hypothetical protein
MIDFLGIGAQKAGTTWLMENLSMHPAVWTPFMKELHYFDTLHLDWPRELQLANFRKVISWMGADIDAATAEYLDRATEDGFCFTDEWYRYLFSVAPPAATTGEFTPYYSCLNIAGIEHVKRLAQDVKLIYLIRDPVERAVSSLRMELGRDPSISQKQLVSSGSFQARGDYRANITNWEAIFDRDSFLYLPYGKITSQPGALMGELERYLGLPAFNGYTHLHERVFATEAVAIDSDALAVIHEFARPQYAFLQDRFGAEFTNCIK